MQYLKSPSIISLFLKVLALCGYPLTELEVISPEVLLSVPPPVMYQGKHKVSVTGVVQHIEKIID
jgi:hypothetical protein